MYLVGYREEKEDWSVRKRGADRASVTVETKKEAVKKGKKLAKKHGTELRVHRMNGTVQYERDYR